mmetsp:Transcript_14658/g.31278  ORF Transcript_14658/g.31278 Transcript_14658/m.31278 type:complete len:440 (-) Transcript_14658:504-1823(-)
MELVAEHLAILRLDDRLNGSTEHLDVILVEDPLEVHIHGAVERRLSSHGDDDTVGLLLLDNFLDEVRRDREEVRMIGLVWAFVVHVGLDRSDVGVHENNLLALFLERLDGLSSGVVEFSRLSNRRSARAKKKHLLDNRLGWGRFAHRELNRRLGILARGQKRVKHELGIGGAILVLGMELSREVRTRFVDESLVTVVVEVGEQFLVVIAQGGGVNVIPVILRGDVTLPSCVVDHWLILPTVAERKLLRLTSCRNTQQLISQTNTEDRLHLALRNANSLLQLLDRLLTVRGISRSVREEDSIELVHVSREGMVPRHDSELDSPINHKSDHIVLHSAVHSHDFDGIARSVHFRLLDTHFSDQMTIVGVLPRGRRRCIQIHLNASNHGTLFANLFREHARVDVAKTGNSLFLEPVAEGRRGLPVGVMMGVILHDKARCVDFG